ncbi:MAG TPA: dihydropteroate synthase [Burkholderiaceae bacterium]|nr:dihydropteroate synthase [Burkholderiaceae bacterium]
MLWQTSRHSIDLSRPRVMGIVNVTPDSFFDGGRHLATDAARAHCDRLVQEGADILDIGGESTRPGAHAPSEQEEIDRVLPVLEHACTLQVPVSVDTSSPALMRAALAAHADIVNDVRALRRPGALEAVASHGSCGVCLMHMLGEDPAAMQQAPSYDDVVGAVSTFLQERMHNLQRAGVDIRRVALDPGIGFGKTPEHNWQLMQRQSELIALGRPLLVGWSRKSTLGLLIGRDASERLAASVAAALAAVQRGAHIVRVHDVAATVDALAVWRRSGLAA